MSGNNTGILQIGFSFSRFVEYLSCLDLVLGPSSRWLFLLWLGRERTGELWEVDGPHICHRYHRLNPWGKICVEKIPVEKKWQIWGLVLTLKNCSETKLKVRSVKKILEISEADFIRRLPFVTLAGVGPWSYYNALVIHKKSVLSPWYEQEIKRKLSLSTIFFNLKLTKCVFVTEKEICFSCVSGPRECDDFFCNQVRNLKLNFSAISWRLFSFDQSIDFKPCSDNMWFCPLELFWKCFFQPGACVISETSVVGFKPVSYSWGSTYVAVQKFLCLTKKYKMIS